MSNRQYSPGGFNILPDVVKNLLIINGLFFIATFVLNNTFSLDLVRIMGLYPIGTEYFKPYQLVTHLFMHGSLMHIFFNMFALWMFGNALENVWGGKKFLIYYLVTGFGAAAIHLGYSSWQLYNLGEAAQTFAANPNPEDFLVFMKEYVPSSYHQAFMQVYENFSIGASTSVVNQWVELRSNVPTVGASGAVFGVLLAFGMMFPNTVIYLYFALPIKAKYFVILYGAIELWSGLRDNPDNNVAHFAHLGGMLFGYILIKYWRKNGYGNSSFY